MSELDDFRPRIRNWAHVYSDCPARGESNIMPFLRSIDKEAHKETEHRIIPDYRDAEFVEECIKDLRLQSTEFDSLFLCIKAEYLIHWPTPESLEDERRLLMRKAAVAKVFWWRFAECLVKAETLLMRYAERS